MENSMDRRAWWAQIWMSTGAHTHTQNQLRHFTSFHQLTYPNAMLPGTSCYQSTNTPVLPSKEKRHWLMERGEKQPKNEIKDWQSQNCYRWIFKSWWQHQIQPKKNHLAHDIISYYSQWLNHVAAYFSEPSSRSVSKLHQSNSHEQVYYPSFWVHG